MANVDNLPSRLFGSDRQTEVRIKYDGDTESIRGWLNRRADSLKDARLPFEKLWLDIRDNIEPKIGQALDNGEAMTEGERRDEKIKCSFARDLAHRYADGMQSGVTNPNNNWFEFVQEKNGNKVRESKSLKEWFDFITQQVSRCMQRSNVYRVTNQVYLHAGVFGTACAMLIHGEKPGEVYLHLIDEGNYWIAENQYHRVDTLLRRMRITIAQAVEEFGLSALPERWCDLFDTGRNEELVTVWNLICPNVRESKLFVDVNRDSPFASFYWADEQVADGDNNGIIRISQYSYNPIIAYRHMHSFSSVYGIGIGELSLPDVKQLYYLEMVIAKLIGNEANPPLMAPSSMKGKAINEFPGGITYVDNMSAVGGAPIQRLFQTNINPEVTIMKQQQVKDSINSLWHGDLFAMMLNISKNRQDMTAREVNELSGEKVALLGPILTGMNDDFLNPMVDGIFTILYEDGFLEDDDHEIPDECIPYEGEEPEITIGTEFVSTIHTEALANLRMRGMFKLMDVVAMLAQVNPDVMAKIDCDQLVDEISNVYRTTAPFVRTDKEALEIRATKAREEAAIMQQQQLADMAKTAGSQAKALSETQTGNGSALDDVIAAGGGLQ